MDRAPTDGGSTNGAPTNGGPTGGGPTDDRSVPPSDWPTEPERQFARAQYRLAEHHDVAVASRTVDTEAAGRVHYLEAGDPDGEAVVLLHGVGSDAATWIPALPALTDDYRVIAPDRPGMGLSGRPSYQDVDLRSYLVAYLLELFEVLELERPHVVGNSLGGQQALFLTLDHDAVDRLCLVGGPGGVSQEFPLLFRLMTAKGINRLLYWLTARGDPLETAQKQTATVLVDDPSDVSAVFYEVLAAASQIPARNRSLRSLQTQQGAWLQMHPTFDIRDEIVTIERPTCFAWGTEDYFWPPAVGQPLAEQMPTAEFHVLEGHGHMPWMDAEEAATDVIRSFLDG
jgi:2-hydroxymuconate-semialdehyde hydrolase